MERTLISITPVNFVTIGLMAIGSFLLFAVVYQIATQLIGGGRGGGTAPAGLDTIQVFGGGDIADAGGVNG